MSNDRFLKRSQSGTLELSQRQHSQYLSYIFIKQWGVIVSTIINTSVAGYISIQLEHIKIN